MPNAHHISKALALILLAAPLAACDQNSNQNKTQTGTQAETSQTAPAEQASDSTPPQAAAPTPAPKIERPPPQASAPPPQTYTPPPPAAPNRNYPPPRPANAQRRIHNAAEHFQVLANEAHTADRNRLEALTRRAGRDARDVRPLLSHAEWNRMHAQVLVLRDAERGGRRNEIEDAARAAYAVLSGNDARDRNHYGSQPAESGHGNRQAGDHGKDRTAQMPPAFNRIDAAAQRYRKDLQADQVHWADMRRQAGIIKKDWRGLRARVGDRKLRRDMAQAISAMEQASADKDEDAARRAIKRERDANARLEAYFRKK